MKIAFATSGDDLNAPLDNRFGRAPRFLVYDLEAEAFCVVDNPHCTGANPELSFQAAQTVVGAGACCLVIGPCDPHLCHALCPFGIRLYNTDAPSVCEALAQYRSGDLAANVAEAWWG